MIVGWWSVVVGGGRWCEFPFQLFSKVLFLVVLKSWLNYSSRFPEGVSKKESQQWWQARPRPWEKETLNIMLGKKARYKQLRKNIYVSWKYKRWLNRPFHYVTFHSTAGVRFSNRRGTVNMGHSKEIDIACINISVIPQILEMIIFRHIPKYLLTTFQFGGPNLLLGQTSF